MENILLRLKDIPGVLGVYLTSTDGKMLFSSSSLDNSPIVISGLSASIKAYLSTLLQEIKMGDFVDIILNGSLGRVVITVLKSGDILSVFMTSSSNLGRVKYEISNVLNALNEEK